MSKTFQMFPKCPKLSQEVQKNRKCPSVDGRLYKVDSRQSTIKMSPKQKIYLDGKVTKNWNFTKTQISPKFKCHQYLSGHYQDIQSLALIALALFSFRVTKTCETLSHWLNQFCKSEKPFPGASACPRTLIVD